MSLAQDIHTLIFSGSLKKGGTWGGPTCTAHIPWETHVYETISWIGLCIVLYKLLNLSRFISLIQSHHDRSVVSMKGRWSVLDGLVLLLISGLWLQVLYYRIRIQSLVNLLQPCHLSLLLQSLAIYLSGRSALSYFLALITLPMTIGAVAAIAVPATEGLDQPLERTSFFIQHYVLLVTPLYLLLRQNFNLYKITTFSGILFGNWFSLVLHWCGFAPFDRFFEVNVNFFLCPSEGLYDVLQALPTWMILPSYRTLVVIIFFVAAIPLCYIYVGLASIIHSLIGMSAKESKKIE